jgi:hypothetical protein
MLNQTKLCTHLHKNIDLLIFAIQHRHVYVLRYERSAYLDRLGCMPEMKFR